jgi:hypothetical protein
MITANVTIFKIAFYERNFVFLQLMSFLYNAWKLIRNMNENIISRVI